MVVNLSRGRPAAWPRAISARSIVRHRARSNDIRLPLVYESIQCEPIGHGVLEPAVVVVVDERVTVS